MLIGIILEFYSTHLMNKEKFIKLLTVFSLSQKGLTIEEIIAITNVSDEEWKLFLGVFKVFVLNFKGLWIVNSDLLKRIVFEKFKLEPSLVSE